MSYVRELIIASLVIVMFLFIMVTENKSNRIKALEFKLSKSTQEVEYLKSETGNLLARARAAEVRADDFKRIYPEIANTLMEDFDVRVKDLKAFIRSEISVVSSGDGTITNNHYYVTSKGDSVRYSEFSMNDGYLRMSASLFDSLHSPYRYEYTDTISVAVHTKKKWFLGKETLYTTSTLANPSARVVGGTSVLVNDYRDKRFGLGIGVYYVPNMGTRIGFGLQYNLIKF